MTAPDGLGPAGVVLWGALRGDWEWRTDEEAVLVEACRVADQIADLEVEMVGVSPVGANGAGTPVVHPAIVEIRLQRQLLASLLSRLRFEDDAGSWDGLSASQRARKAARARYDR